MKLGKLLLGVSMASLTMFSAFNAEAFMTFDQALAYQSAYKEEFVQYNKKAKDLYGNKQTFRYFSCLGNHGVLHPGETQFNVLLNYGPVGSNVNPEIFMKWMVRTKGKPDQGYIPNKLIISFNDGTIKNLPIQTWEYLPEFMPYYGLMHYYVGDIKINEYDLYDLNQHGGLANVGIAYGGDYVQFCFFSGDKEADKKEKLRVGIKHALKVLQVDENTLLAKKAEYDKQQEELRLAKMRADIEKELKEAEEREAMKKQILAERAAKAAQ